MSLTRRWEFTVFDAAGMLLLKWFNKLHENY